MKLSKKSEYAIYALVEITLSSGEDEAWLQISQIAEAAKIPEKFLEQILLTLKKAGLLQSRRGTAGGYALKLKPEQISLDQIILLLDGSESAQMDVATLKEGRQKILHNVMVEAETAAQVVLKATTLADLAQRFLVLKSAKSSLDYTI